jgi:hypothetical protein
MDTYDESVNHAPRKAGFPRIVNLVGYGKVAILVEYGKNAILVGYGKPLPA